MNGAKTGIISLFASLWCKSPKFASGKKMRLPTAGPAEWELDPPADSGTM